MAGTSSGCFQDVGTMKNLKLEKENSIYTLTLNRPEVRNAFDDLMIAEMTRVFRELHRDRKVRVVIIKGEGESFCAGGDLRWMKSTIDYSEQENRKDANLLYEMFEALLKVPVPVMALVHGHVMGGGLGLIATCDISFAVRGTLMCFSETRLGMAPSVISPFVARKVRISDLNRYFLTAEFFNCQKALDMGLIQGWGSRLEMEERIAKLSKKILNNGPKALRVTKALLSELSSLQDSKKRTTELIASLRVSREGQEGLKAFLEKRKPQWAEFPLD